jgi:hypothetical protein
MLGETGWYGKRDRRQDDKRIEFQGFHHGCWLYTREDLFGLRGGYQGLLNRVREFDAEEQICRIQVVFAGFVNYPKHTVFRSGFIGDGLVNLSDFQIFTIVVRDTNNEFHGSVAAHSQSM